MYIVAPDRHEPFYHRFTISAKNGLTTWKSCTTIQRDTPEPLLLGASGRIKTAFQLGHLSLDHFSLVFGSFVTCL
jgi:hypothetical protein